MNQILIVYTDKELKLIKVFSEAERQDAWNAFKKQLAAADSSTAVELMTEDEFLNRIIL